MKRIISLTLTTLLLISLLAVPGFCKPYSVEISTDIGGFEVVLTDNDLISLPPAELEMLLKTLIEKVGMSKIQPSAIYFPDEIIVYSGHSCSPAGPYSYKYGGNNYVYYSDGTLWYTFCMVVCRTASCSYDAVYIQYA